jgi:hypothetical protein
MCLNRLVLRHVQQLSATCSYAGCGVSHNYVSEPPSPIGGFGTQTGLPPDPLARLGWVRTIRARLPYTKGCW